MLDTMSVSYSWIFCFTFLLLIHKVSVKSVEGVIGQTVMLPCSFTQKSVNVVWRYRDSRPVCDIIDGKADYDEQDPAYRGRVSLFSSEIDQGNFSIMLSNVVESDAGTYTCTSPGLHRVKIELTVTERPVTTKRPETQTTTQKKSRRSGNGDVTRQADGLLTVLLACALLCSLLF